VIGRPVHRFDGDEDAVAEGQHRELARRRVARDHRLVGARKDPGDLQLRARLVGPEPRQAGVRRRRAGDRRGHAAGLVDGVLHGLQPGLGAGLHAREVRAVADGEDPFVRRAQVRVDGHAVAHRQPGGLGQRGFGHHPDGDDDQIGGQPGAVGQLDLADALVAVQRRDALAEQHRVSRVAVQRGEVGGDLRRRDPVEQPVLRLDDRHRAAGVRGELQPDEPAAGHDDVLRPRE
jgi:hypothetical protein